MSGCLNVPVDVCNNFGDGLYICGRLFCHITKSASQHLLVTREIVWPFHSLDFETAVLAGLWSPCLKNHHSPYRVRSLRIRDIIALYALRGSRQVERFLQLLQRQLRFLAIGQPFYTLLLQYLARVLLHHLNYAQLVTPFRSSNVDCALAFLAQP